MDSILCVFYLLTACEESQWTGHASSACCVAGLHFWLLCLSLDTLILSNYKEFQMNFVASAPWDLLSVRALYFNLVILLLLALRG